MSWFHRKIKDGIAGTAYVSSCGGVPPDLQVAITIDCTYRCPMNLVVQLPDHEPYGVETEVDADPDRPVEAGMTLSVVVDPRDPQHIEVDVDAIPSSDERADAALQADVERLRDERRNGGSLAD